MLNTVDYDWVRVVSRRPIVPYDSLFGIDLGCDWEYWYIVEGEIVAFYIGDSEEWT